MKNLFLSLCMAVLTLSAFCQKTETRQVSGFTGIDASSAFEITVAKGSTESLTIEADDNVMSYVRSEVKSGVLHLYIDNSRKLKNIKTLKANIVMKNIDKVTLSGACKLTGSGIFTPDNFRSDCSGATKLDLQLNTGSMTVKTSGASKINLKAEVANDVKFDVSGASKMDLDLKATKVQMDASGSSKAEISGTASSFQVEASGASKVNAGDFIVETATVKSSGSCNITLHVNKALNVNSSGASSINYKGSPAINSDSSGSTKIRKI